MIIGIGTDILDTKRIRALIEKHGGNFLDRWFSPGEIAYCQGKNKPYIHFAARMSAKEAVAKAIRIDPAGSIPWKYIAVEKGGNGEPTAVLSGRPLERAGELGIKHIHLSISHCDDYVTATAIAEN